MKTEIFKFPAKQFGVQIQFDCVTIINTFDKRRVDYATAFESCEFKKTIKIDFFSVNGRIGFGIYSQNAICWN